MNPDRRAALLKAKMRVEGSIVQVEGKEFIKPGVGQVLALRNLRRVLIPPAPPGAGDTQNDDVDPVEYRREMNRRKRERKARAT